MTRFLSPPTITYNEFRQKKVVGKIFLSKNFQLLNIANNGKSPLDSDWEHPESVNLKAGEIVTYTMQETATGKAHSVRWTANGITFEKVM